MKRICTLFAFAGLALLAHAQSASGKWLGSTNGAEIAIHLVGTATNLTGSMVSVRGGQPLTLSILDAKVTNRLLQFSVQMGPARADFSCELSSNEMSLRMVLPNPTGPAVVLNRVDTFPAAIEQAFAAASAGAGAPSSAPPGWQAFNRAARFVDEGTKRVLRVDGRPLDGVIWLEGSDFKEGSISLELRGTNVPQQSFVGVAFRGADDTNYDAVYFRPFNFRAADAARLRAVQYVSHPEYPWMKLRTDSPEKYEQPVSPVPDPNGWFRARIQVEGDEIKVFVNDSPTSALTVTALSKRQNGRVGFWVGNNSGGDFANLRLQPK